MKRHKLEFLADRIEATLARHRITVRITGGDISPRCIRFHALPALNTQLGGIEKLAGELALALHSDTCRVSRHGRTALIEIPHPDPPSIRLLPLQRRLSARQEIPPGAALLGLTGDGAPLLVRLPSPQIGHLLIAGAPGAGKTALAHTIIASLTLSHRHKDLAFVLIDSRRHTFGPLAELPYLLQPVLTEPHQATQVLADLARLTQTRQKQSRIPRVVVVVDDLTDLLRATGKPTRRALVRLAQQGREAGIHLIACTRQPDAELTQLFPLRLVGRVASPEQARVATGYAGTGAERLKAPGDFIAVARGQATRFHVAHVTSRELADLVSQVRQFLPAPPATVKSSSASTPASKPGRPGSQPTNKQTNYHPEPRPEPRPEPVCGASRSDSGVDEGPAEGLAEGQPTNQTSTTATEIFLFDPSLALLLSFPFIHLQQRERINL